MKPQISNFETLPDEARVSAETFAVLMDVHENTVWRRAKNDPSFPKPIKLGTRCTRFRVGDIRAFMKGVAA
ncbi:MAG: hypothetical protein PWQ61_1583 [Betaproteobacteria bacterium]|nr:hypothetical protein [Betaproteobacteria bacterium]